MFLIARPTEESIRQFIAGQKDTPFSYHEPGLTKTTAAPDGFTIDHNQALLGKGRATFDRAIEAIRSWKMFDISWVKLNFDNTPIEAGQTVAILISHFGFWSLNA